jgi:hypothetical protein
MELTTLFLDVRSVDDSDFYLGVWNKDFLFGLTSFQVP